jgi:hypothetical protein
MHIWNIDYFYEITRLCIQKTDILKSRVFIRPSDNWAYLCYTGCHKAHRSSETLVCKWEHVDLSFACDVILKVNFLWEAGIAKDKTLHFVLDLLPLSRGLFLNRLYISKFKRGSSWIYSGAVRTGYWASRYKKERRIRNKSFLSNSKSLSEVHSESFQQRKSLALWYFFIFTSVGSF